jgi:hypothetical protein
MWSYHDRCSRTLPDSRSHPKEHSSPHFRCLHCHERNGAPGELPAGRRQGRLQRLLQEAALRVRHQPRASGTARQGLPAHQCDGCLINRRSRRRSRQRFDRHRRLTSTTKGRRTPRADSRPPQGPQSAPRDYRGQPGTTAANFRTTSPTTIMESPAQERARRTR